MWNILEQHTYRPIQSQMCRRFESNSWGAWSIWRPRSSSECWNSWPWAGLKMEGIIYASSLGHMGLKKYTGLIYISNMEVWIIHAVRQKIYSMTLLQSCRICNDENLNDIPQQNSKLAFWKNNHFQDVNQRSHSVDQVHNIFVWILKKTEVTKLSSSSYYFQYKFAIMTGEYQHNQQASK